jgi:hypothetical protein
MDTNLDPLEKNHELITHLMRSHMSSFSVNAFLGTAIGDSRILHAKLAGPINDQQRELLDSIDYSLVRLSDHLHIFIIASRLIFTPEKIYETDINLLDIIEDFIKRTAETTEFQIEKEILANPASFKGDGNLIGTSINCIGQMIKQIHPTHRGWVKILVAVEGDFVIVVFSTNKDEAIYPANENPELFIVQTVAELHGGKFEIVDSEDDMCNLIFTLPIKK